MSLSHENVRHRTAIVRINQLTQQCNLFDFLLLCFYFFMNFSHQRVHLFDMIAKFSEAGITLVVQRSCEYILCFGKPDTPHTGRPWLIL